MTLREQIKLIPRNNWDFGFDALLRTIAGALQPAMQSPNMGRVFQQEPVWTNSGRTSLYAILKALELPPGAKVGVPLFCCPVVFNAIRQAGLTPRFIDSNLDDCNLSIKDLRRKRADLAAVVAVHLFGHPCDMDAINEAAESIPVIEDCAQSVFSTYKGQRTGFLSTASFFSFRCGKYLSAGEGSAIFCREPGLKKKIAAVVSSFESRPAVKMVIDSLLTFLKAALYNRPWYGLVGYPVGMRLDKTLNLTAKDGFETGKISSAYLALIDARIAHFQKKINIQRDHAHQFLETITPGYFDLPTESSESCSNWQQFALRFHTSGRRDAMADFLLKRGIDTAKYLDHIVDEACIQYGYFGDCPNAEKLSKTVLLVPIHYTLRASDIQHIANAINAGAQIIRTIGGRVYYAAEG